MTRPVTAILGLCAAAAAFAVVAADAPEGAPLVEPQEEPESASQTPGEVRFTATPVWGASLSFSEPVQQLFRVGAYTPAWKMRASSGGARIAGKDGAARAFAIDMGAAQGENVAAGTTRFDGRAEFRRLADGGIEADWTVVPNRSDELPEVMVEARIALGRVAGGFAVDGRRVELPETAAKNPHLFRGKVHDLELIGANGAPWLAVELPEGCDVLLQDNRAWGGSVATLRLFFAQKAVEAGRAYRVHAVFRVPGAAGELESSEQVSIAQGPDWIPVEIAERGANWIEPGSALDLLSSLPHHEPAGKYGRVVAVGDHFELEGRPGEEIRFAGVNLVHGANTPPKDAAENFAANLARFGINSVRLHHHERPLLAKGDPAGIAVDPDAQDRFDALCAACIRHGIYLTTDLYVSRVPVAWRAIGVDRDGTMTKEDFKIACLFHEGAYSNLVEWSRQFLTHVNPYTGRSLADEPALATLALVNEGNLGNGGRDPLIAIPGVREAWEKWLDGKIAGEAGISGASGISGQSGVSTLDWAAIPRDLTQLQHDLYESKTADKALSEAFALFLADSEAAFARRIGAFVRDGLGCNVPVSSISSWYNPAVYSLVREGFDYDDDHGYVDHPFFLGRPWRLPSTHIGANPLLGGDGVPSFAWRRLFGKPFCATEWNWAAPGEYRQASGLVMGALAARQGWSGMWRFAWSHDSIGVERPGNVRMRYFDLHADPSLCASERAVVTLFRRGDLAPIARGEDAPVVKDADAL
ncbi:MAG: hypothetical protein IJ678_07555, partial [Kiritimatiellae bacterium]|nr:hypothetical protein [Kiritimatiellia bacterium]